MTMIILEPNEKRNSSKIRCVCICGCGKYIPGIQVNQQPNADKMYACTESQGSWMHMERMTENKNRTNNKKNIYCTNQPEKKVLNENMTEKKFFWSLYTFVSFAVCVCVHMNGDNWMMLMKKKCWNTQKRYTYIGYKKKPGCRAPFTMKHWWRWWLWI